MRRIVLLLVLLVIVATSVFLLWRQFRPAEPITVGIVTKLASGAVAGFSDMDAGDLFLEEHPKSRTSCCR